MIYILFYLLLLIFSYIKNKQVLLILQQNLYNTNNRYLKWLNKNKKKVFLNLELVSLILLILSILSNLFLVIAAFIYLLEALILINQSKSKTIKKPLVITKRIIRLNITYYLIIFIPLIIYLINSKAYIMLIITGILIYFSYLTMYIAKIINTPIEKYVYHYYLKKALKKLYSMPNLKVIGITGSYGKTSSKNILNEILKDKYLTLPTPKNLNTEYGMMITINNYLDKFTEILIAEMGAYKRGEIKRLCDIVKPKYAILTTIGLAHLESFGSEENIIKTKFELVEALPSDGICILNKDDPKQTSYNIKNTCQKIWIGIDNKDADIYALNIKNTHLGSEFDIVIKNNKYHFKTKLLGKHNIYNILASVALGHALGMSIDELIRSVARVKSVENRLQLIDFGYMYQINDAYNSNPVGANMAIDVLKTMPGYKVVVTPGMTELGEKQDECNQKFGEYIGTTADLVILVGKKQTEAVLQGLNNKYYPSNKIIIVNNVYEAYNKLKELKVKEDIYALFENDLPDIYDE